MEERQELLERYAGYRRVACVVLGEPVEAFKAFSRQLLLRAKQEAMDAEYRQKVLEERRRGESKVVDDTRKVGAEERVLICRVDVGFKGRYLVSSDFESF